MPLTHTTKGRVISTTGDTVVFRPQGTTYELHLKAAGGRYDGPVDATVNGVIRARARKAYSVPSGGLFVTPIMGPTRIVQGRVIDIEANAVALSAVATVNVTLPTTAGAVELASGPIAHGSLVNVILEPGATFEPAGVPATAAIPATRPIPTNAAAPAATTPALTAPTAALE